MTIEQFKILVALEKTRQKANVSELISATVLPQETVEALLAEAYYHRCRCGG